MRLVVYNMSSATEKPEKRPFPGFLIVSPVKFVVRDRKLLNTALNHQKKEDRALGKILFLCSLWALFPLRAEEPAVKVACTPSRNLLVNADFRETQGNHLPNGWFFADMANSKKIKYGLKQDGNKPVLWLETPGNLPGYWCQSKPVAVKENETYYAEVEVKAAGPRVLLWLSTRQFDDKKSPLHHPRSQTTVYSFQDSRLGEAAKKEIELFIDPELVAGITPECWHKLQLEFKVPPGNGIKDYDYRVGAYYRAQGWIKFRNPYLGLARRSYEFQIAGKNLVKFSVVNVGSNQTVQTFSLDPAKNEQSVSIELPSGKNQYKWEILTAAGKSFDEVFQ